MLESEGQRGRPKELDVRTTQLGSRAKEKAGEGRLTEGSRAAVQPCPKGKAIRRISTERENHERI